MHSQRHINIPRPLWEPKSLTPIITTEQQRCTLVKTSRRTRRKCHGNRKLRRFKKKCIRQGLNKEEIQKLIDEYNNHKKNENNPQEMEIPTLTTMDKKKKKRKSNKRKQMSTSASQRSITSRIPKKIKKSTLSLHNPVSKKLNYRLPKYLKKAPNLLFQSLRLQLNKKLNTKSQQQFLHYRLQLIDQQYRLNLHQNLWQNYMNIGSQQQIWPNQIYSMTKTNQHHLCQQYVRNRLTEINQQYEQCTTELLIQSQLCPKRFLPLDKLDHNLNEFVHIQQKYLSNKINAQLNRFKNIIEEKKLFQTLYINNLTNIQKETIDRLNNLRNKQLDIFEEFLKLEIHVSMDFLPKNFDHLENFIESDFYLPIIKDHLAIDFKQQQYKIIQDAKRTWLNIFMDIYEIEYQNFEYQYQQELKKFELICLNNIQRNITVTTTLFNSFLTYMNYRTNRIKQEIYYEKIPIYRRNLLRRCRHHHRQRLNLKLNKKLVNVHPIVIIELIRHPFTRKEIAHLSKGPSYIRPNQSALRPFEQREKQIQMELNTIMNKIKRFMNELKDPSSIPTTSSLYKSYSDRLHAYLMNSYLTPLSLIDQIRARQELKIVKSIRRKLKKYKLILRVTDKSGVFHIGHAKDYNQKAVKYRQDTGAYEELNINPFDEIIYNVTHLLNELQRLKKITEDQRKKLIPIRHETELAYMYFLPKSHKKGTPLRPIINTIHAVTTKISKFLDRLIRPLFDCFVRQTTIVDGVDLLDKFQNYIQQDYFKSSTLFITFDISNLYTMLPQEESLKILSEFLHEYQCDYINNLSIETIIELSRIVLQANVFVYGNKFYRQIIGGAMGSAFTLTLANIFMWKWEKQTILSKLSSHELYGRYIDDVFFTWNGSETDVKQLLEQANQFHTNIKLEYKIDKNLPFLDIFLRNNNGQLSTSVYHKSAAEPAVLSFLSDHPRHIFRNIIQTALIRAIRYSSTFEAFNCERRTIRLMLLYNSYPSTYINEQFQKFFLKYNTSTSPSIILPLIENEQEFFKLREKLRAQLSIKQIQMKKSAATVSIIMHNIENNPKSSTTTTTSSKPIMKAIVKRNENEKFKTNIFIHCLHEARLQGVQRYLHEIHDSFFKNTDYKDIRLVVGHRNNPNLDFELSSKRPRASLLKDPSRKNRAKKIQ